MIVNGIPLLQAAPIRDMIVHKVKFAGVSHGLSEAGYDIRLKQHVEFKYLKIATRNGIEWQMVGYIDGVYAGNRFILGSAVEEFDMPDNLVGIVHDKSTWARQGLSVLNTVIEPGWKGFLTLELIYHGHTPLEIPAGAGIAQVIFHETATKRPYVGKYQDQADQPVPSKFVL